MDTLPDRVETKRLLLRHWLAQDAAALHEAINTSIEHLRPWMGWIANEPLSEDDRRDLFERWHREWERGGDTILGIFRDGRPVGSTGLLRRDGEPGIVEIGYWIHTDQTRRGFAIEASEALTEAAFAMPSIRRVEIHHDKANTASACVPRRLGFTMFDEVPREINAPGQVGIECQWAITRPEWQSRTPTSLCTTGQ